MVKILMMSAKIATPVFWSKGHYVIYYFYDVINIISSHESNYIMYVLMWPKFGNSRICIREVIITSILQGFDQKNRFFWGVVLVQVQYFGTDTRCKLEILHQPVKRIKTKSQKVLVANPYVCRSCRGKNWWQELFCPPSWIGLKHVQHKWVIFWV